MAQGCPCLVTEKKACRSMQEIAAVHAIPDMHTAEVLSGLQRESAAGLNGQCDGSVIDMLQVKLCIGHAGECQETRKCAVESQCSQPGIA